MHFKSFFIALLVTVLLVVSIEAAPATGKRRMNKRYSLAEGAALYKSLLKDNPVPEPAYDGSDALAALNGVAPMLNTFAEAAAPVAGYFGFKEGSD